MSLARAAGFPIDFGWQRGLERYTVAMKVAHGDHPQDVLAPYTGCQLNMLIGAKCCARPSYEPHGVQHYIRLAKRRIDGLFFVGLVAEWRLSVCLFNYKMTGVRYTTELQLKNCRPGGVAHWDETIGRKRNQTLESG